MALLEVENLTVELETSRGPVLALRAADFVLNHGQTLGIVGESGCGKTMMALALMGLLPENARAQGAIRFEGADLLAIGEDNWRDIRGDRMAMIFQEPMTSLNPLHTIGHQVAEPLMVHRGLTRGAAKASVVKLLDRVGLTGGARNFDIYPHQLSGGQRQRVMIAMALVCEPRLLIADEPTTALDVTIQGQILDLINELIEERNMALLLISHDLGIIAEMVTDMLVMYGGVVVESGPTRDVFSHLAHPYTRGLFGARPRLGQKREEPLVTIPGSVPELVNFPKGCPFQDRCAYATPACDLSLPEPVKLSSGHHARCIHLDAVGVLHD